MLAEQAKTLSDAKMLLDSDIKKLETSKNTLVAEIVDLTSQRDALKADITEVERSVKSTNKAIIDNHSILNTLKADISDGTAVLKVQNDEKATLEQYISMLMDEKAGLEQSLTGLKAAIGEHQAKLDSIDAEYAQKTANKEASLKVLDAKLLSVSQRLERIAADEAVTRNEFATRQRTLDERDANLRIREAKVELGEAKLVNNANLMNL